MNLRQTLALLAIWCSIGRYDYRQHKREPCYTLTHLAKHHVLPVQPRQRCERNEELRAVTVAAWDEAPAGAKHAINIGRGEGG